MAHSEKLSAEIMCMQDSITVCMYILSKVWALLKGLKKSYSRRRLYIFKVFG